MQLYTAKEILKWEEFTVKTGAPTQFNLIKKASTLFANWVDKKLLKDNMPIAVICGWGNNAADGYTVAKILLERKSPVVCYDLSIDNQFNAFCENAKNDFPGEIIQVHSISDLDNLFKFDLVIDAILGIGANRAFSPKLELFINYINANSKHIMSIDMPSGMLSEIETEHTTIEANETLTFTSPKLSFFSALNEKRLGKWVYRDLELSDKFVSNAKPPIFLTRELMRGKIQSRSKFSHKGTFGHILMLGGEIGKAGAIHLSGKAAYRLGAGLVSLGSCEENRTILQTLLPESMFHSLGSKTVTFSELQDSKYNVIGIGPGLGMQEGTIHSFASFLKSTKQRLVLDADALNIIALNELHLSIPANSILTPHPKEFDRLFGECKDDFERRNKQKELSIKYSIFIVLKGAYSTISCPDGKFYYNSTGNPGMAVGGSGDILTGMICALLSQGYSELESTILAVYLHGLAGDIAAKELGELNMISSDIIDKFSLAINMIK